MGDWRYPHSVTVYSLSQPPASGSRVAGNPSKGAGVSVRCDLQERTPGFMAEAYGFDLNNPAVLYCAVADAGHFSISALVDFDGVQYSVVGKPRLDRAGDELDGLSVPLEKLEFPR